MLSIHLHRRARHTISVRLLSSSLADLGGAELRVFFLFSTSARSSSGSSRRVGGAATHHAEATMSEIDSLFAMMDGGDVDAGT